MPNMTAGEFFEEAKRLNCRMLPEGDDLRACLDAKDAQIAALSLEAAKWRQFASDAHYVLTKARIWGGMAWVYSPLHPIHYKPVFDKLDAAFNAEQMAHEAATSNG